MPHLTQLHRSAREIFDHALSSVDPRKAVKQAVKIDGPFVDIDGVRLDVSSRAVYAIAIGKAATSMAAGLDEVLAEKLSRSVISGGFSIGSVLNSNRWQSFAGGHPLPNQASLEAARSTFALLDQASAEQAIVVFLISGGGSAMIEWPVSNEISLADLRLANQVLVGSGASIAEINSVRRAFSAVKGGALGRRASGAQIVTLIVSDTNHGDEASVASGPSLAASPDTPHAVEVVEKYYLEAVLPQSILKAVRRARTSAPVINESHRVLLDNSTAIKAACEKTAELGFACVTPEDICEQPIQDGCDLLVSRLFAQQIPEPFGVISGGEFSCPVRGDGRGGRNLETVLRCALRLDQEKKHAVVLSAGTDGIDGNSTVAGAIADETTIDRARSLGLDANHFLARSDSYSFFAPLNDLIVTGPTGTNVRDLRILLRSS